MPQISNVIQIGARVPSCHSAETGRSHVGGAPVAEGHQAGVAQLLRPPADRLKQKLECNLTILVAIMRAALTSGTVALLLRRVAKKAWLKCCT